MNNHNYNKWNLIDVNKQQQFIYYYQNNRNYEIKINYYFKCDPYYTAYIINLGSLMI